MVLVVRTVEERAKGAGFPDSDDIEQEKEARRDLVLVEGRRRITFNGKKQIGKWKSEQPDL